MADWQTIGTEPKDGTHFLAAFIDYCDELDEDNRVIARAVPTPGIVVAYYCFGNLIDNPYTGAIITNRRWTHWQTLPEPPVTP